MSGGLVLLKRTYDPTEAHIIRGLLESNDIPAFVMDDQISSVNWLWQIGVGGVRIMILREDYQIAVEVLSAQNVSGFEPLPRETLGWYERFEQFVFFLMGMPVNFRKRFLSKQDRNKE